jgi:hypothetical protein
VQSALSGQLSSRNFLCRPPEPTPDLLLSPPSSSIYIGKTHELSVPFYWDPSKLLNPHICVAGMTGSGKSVGKPVAITVTLSSPFFKRSSLIVPKITFASLSILSVIIFAAVWI